jgi:hypothetical protein
MLKAYTGWWFGKRKFIYIGNFIIPTDFHTEEYRGVETSNQL